MKQDKQAEKNAKWLVPYATNVGTCVILTPPKRTVPGLKPPYEYEREVKDVTRLVALLKLVLNTKTSPLGQKMQCAHLEVKQVRYGVRLSVFALGCDWRREVFRNSDFKSMGFVDGVTEKEWLRFNRYWTAILCRTLGRSVAPYIEPWKSGVKFQARFETYIKYSEL